MITPIIQPKELVALADTSEIVIVDAGAAISYATQHLKGAVHADLNNDLSTVPGDAANGGRHPLPAPEVFAQTLGRLGITPQSHVIVYDDQGGALAAARFWWMLKAAGHEKVQVVNGGLSAVAKAGFTLSDLVEIPVPTSPYPFTAWHLPMADIDEVAKAASDASQIVIDVRDSVRYRGETEILDAAAGHVPGAVNIPYATNFDEDGMILSPTELRDKFMAELGTVPPENAIVHCGSGVTACHTLLAMAYAGLPVPKLYVGSWSEWSRSGRAIATGA